MVKQFRLAGLAFAGLLATGLPLFAQPSGVSAQTVVTVMPKKGTDSLTVSRENIQVTADRKQGTVTDWIPLRGERSGLELVLLIDDSSRSSIGTQLESMRKFINHLPEGTEVGVAYMQNGQARFVQNLTADRRLASQALRLPLALAGASASPYFSLSDLAKHWPSANPDNRREVLMITDGIEPYDGRRYDPDDPYVQASIKDSQKAGLIVYSIYFGGAGGFGRSRFATFGGQNYLDQVSSATGGKAFYIGLGNPVAFDPFLDELHTRLMNQYELEFMAQPGRKPNLQALKVKTDLQGAEVSAPQQVFVGGAETGSLR